MGLNSDRVLNKISFIREQLNNINNLLRKKTKEEILADPWIIKGLKYSLQVSVEAVIDLSYHIAARSFGSAPADARDALRILSEGGLIAKNNVEVYAAMIGFRNRLVHGYQDVSPERVYETARNELGDFERYIKEISPVLSLNNKV